MIDANSMVKHANIASAVIDSSAYVPLCVISVEKQVVEINCADRL